MLTIKELAIPGYEKVIEGKDPARGLHCYIAVHSTIMGPSLGGTRMHLYASTTDALQDALRLAKAMTYKSAIAQDGLGGGKSVIIADPLVDKSPELLHAFAEVVNSLKGSYIAAEDLGTMPKDMATMHERTPYVCAMIAEHSSGDPSRFTAWGILRGLQAVAMKLWGVNTLRNKTIAIQGLGKVGSRLADLLFWEGADLIVCDIDSKLTRAFAQRCAARIIPSDDFCRTECDILAPCALGGIINSKTIGMLRCKAIAGGANNQLESPDLGDALMKRNILFAPDYIINAGGIINVASEFEEGGYNSKFAREKVDQLYHILLNLFNKSEAEKKPTTLIADETAEYNLLHGIGKRLKPIIFNPL